MSRVKKFSAISSKLAKELQLDSVNLLDELDGTIAIFDKQNEQLILHILLDGKPDVLKFDLAQGEVAHRAVKVSKSNEVIAKAIGCKSHYRPTVLDATAGMGRDSLIMAMLGCHVTMQERNLAIFRLLDNALHRLQNSTEFDSQIGTRLSLQQRDSLQLDEQPTFDVIYLDPMFPERKKSALVKKEMRLFKRIAGEDPDADELLLNALNSHAKRVVVKRPKGAPFLADKKPSHEIKSKKFRYDVYLI